jgi:hypothetical protein
MRQVRSIAYPLFVLIAATAGFPVFAADEKPSKAGHGYLGVSVERLTRDDRKELRADFGVLIADVADGSPAERAGIREDDVLQFFNDAKIRTPEDLVDRVRKADPGDKIRISLIRDSRKIDTEAEIGRARSDRRDFGSRDRGGFSFDGTLGAGLGVRLQELNADLAEYFKVGEHRGVLVVEVEEDGPASEAGLKPGDVIVRFDGEDVETPADLTELLSDAEEGDKVEIEFIRKGETRKVKAELEEREFHFRFPSSGNRTEVRDFDVDVPDCDVRIPEMHVDVPDAVDIDIPEMRVDIPDVNVDIDECDGVIRVGSEDGNEAGIRIEIDEEFGERLKEHIESWKEGFKESMQRLERDLDDMEFTVEM